MARVPLIQEREHPELAEMIARFRAGRRGKLINIYRMLLNAPPLAESWFNHSNTVRWKTTLPGRLREIVIIRMGHLTNTQYVLRASTCHPWRSPMGYRLRNATRSQTGPLPSSSARASAPRSPMPTQ